MTVLHVDNSAGYMHNSSNHKQVGRTGHWLQDQIMSIGENTIAETSRPAAKRPGRRPGRKPSKIDEHAKLERSRQSARECRARKKLRYQYLEELVLNREKAVFALRNELETFKQWCFQLEGGSPLPDALLKMIATEEMSVKRRQMERANQSMLHQQQQQQQQSQLTLSSSTSSSSSSSPPSHLEHQQQQHRQVSVVRPQSMTTQAASFSQYHHNPQQQFHQQRQFSHQPQQFSQQPQQFSQQPQQFSQQPQQYPCQQAQPRQSQQLLQQKQTAGTAVLQRQLAFDHSLSPEQQGGHLSQTSSQMATTGQSYGPGSIFSLANQLQQQRLVQHSGASSMPQRFSLPQFQGITDKHEQVLVRGKSDPQIQHHRSFEESNVLSNTGRDNSRLFLGNSSSSGDDSVRARSLSNPVPVISSRKMNMNTPHVQAASTFSDFKMSQSGSEKKVQQSGPGFDLFSVCFPEASRTSSSLNVPTDDDNSSSDEPINEQQLFQSSITSQKRTLSEPFLPGNPKRMTMMTGNPAFSTSSSTTFDPQSKLHNLTRVTCFDVTKTSSTPSPAFVRTMPSKTPSPTPSLRFSGKSSSTPCSSTTASPAPLSSLSSILELSVSSPGMSSASFDTSMDTSLPSASGPHSGSVVPIPPHCSAMGLIASIGEPIPEWYSFLADLEDGAMSTFTSRHGASSSQGTPVAMTPKQQDQPLTPEPSFMNVPSIIDEILDCEEQLM